MKMATRDYRQQHICALGRQRRRLKRKNLFASRIKPEPALLLVSNVTQMRGLSGPMADPNIAVRQLPGAHAFEKILDVIDGLVMWRFHDRWRDRAAHRRIELV